MQISSLDRPADFNTVQQGIFIHPAGTVRSNFTRDFQRLQHCPELRPRLYLPQIMEKFPGQFPLVSSLTSMREHVVMSDRQLGNDDDAKGRR